MRFIRRFVRPRVVVLVIERFASCRIAPAHWCLLLAILTLPINPTMAQGVLRGLSEIRSHQLEPGSAPEVEFAGVVTYQDPVWRFFFVQSLEEPAGIFVMGRVTNLGVGDCVQVQGSLRAGFGKPYVVSKAVESIGACDLPEPLAMQLTETELEENDALRVQMQCRVEQVIVHARHALLLAKVGNKPIYISVAEWGFVEEAADLLGKQILCSGSLGVQVREDAKQTELDEDTKTDEEKKFAKLFCPSAKDIQVLDGNTIDIGVEEIEVANVEEMTPNGKRFMTHGLISYVDTHASQDYIVVIDSAGSAWMAVETSEGLSRGTIVRVAGKVENQYETPLRADYIRVLAQQEMPIPEAVTVSEAFLTARPPQSLSLVGKPSRFVRDNNRLYLVLRDEESEIDVWLRDEASHMTKTLDPQIAKRVQVLGIVTPSTRSTSNAKYQLVVSAPGDIQLLEEYVFPMHLALVSLGMIAGVVISWIVTLRRQVAQKTQHTVSLNAQLRSSYDSIDDGILAVDNERRILAVNREFCRILGQQLHVGESAAEVSSLLAQQVRDKQKFYDFLEACNSLTEAETTEVELDFVAQKHWIISISSAPIIAGKRLQTIGRIWTLRDETDKRRLESELARSSKLEAVGRLAGGVAHDFNNVLTAISANLSVAKSADDAKVGDVKEELELAEHAAFKGADVVRRLLMFSKQFDLALEPQYIHGIITNLTRLLRHSFGVFVSFELDLCGENPVVQAESAALEQVLMNLYINARDAMPRGGTIRTSTRIFQAGEQRFCRVSIRDEGEGIPAEMREKIFEPFFTTKGPDEGTGLGLSTSFRVVEQHGGSLRLAQSGPLGSELQIDLPLSNEKPIERSSPSHTQGSRSARILVVDDEYAVRFATRRILEGRGFEVFEAKDGEQALNLLFQGHKPVDAVLLDLTMPGMPGAEVLASIKSRRPDLAVLVCSGYLPQNFQDVPFAPDGILTKPYQIDELIMRLNALIGPDAD